jgi:hypothetical protein
MGVQLLRSAKLGLRALQQRSDFGADWLAHSSKGSDAIPRARSGENLGLSGLPGWADCIGCGRLVNRNGP